MIKPCIHTFLTVCETGSFTKAAAVLYITPSAVIQQMNAMEKDLSVTLFDRTPRGISLTEAGQYVYQGARELSQREHQLLEGLSLLRSQRKNICIGTSLMEKCRLLYDLWVLFSEQERGYEIKMLNIDSEHTVPEQTDLIESVNGGVPWTKGWQFMEICQVPFGFAFHKDHPLAGKKKISLDDLQGETIASINNGSSPEIASMLDELRSHGIPVVFLEGSGSSMIWECAFRHYVLVAPVCWDDILINMEMCSCDWDHTMPYGIFHRKAPSPATAHFLEFIRQTYSAGNPAGIVPVLSEW